MAHLSIRVLGGLSVSKGDERVAPFESDKVRALLAYLVVEGDRPHRRAALAGLLWPDCPEQTAHHNLSQALFNLRKVLGDRAAEPPYLRVTREAIQLNRDSDYSLDLEQLNAGYAAWEASRGPAEGELARLEELAALYRGEFLQEFFLKDSAEFEEWMLVQRAAVHPRGMHALQALAEACERSGDLPAARRACLRQLALDPWREEAHRQLMRLLALDGQRSAALAQYEACRKILAAELGVEPSPATRQLYESIRLGKIEPRRAPAAPLPAAPLHTLPLPPTPFLGRERELAELEELIATPDCRCLSLVGAGGMGKTRLALEAAARNRDRFAQGAAFIPLAAVAATETAAAAIAGGVGCALYGPAGPQAQLLNHLRDKELLLVLDNVEHLLAEGSGPAAFTTLITEILQRAPQVKLLVTSRQALNVGGEWCYEVHGLEYPAVDTMDRAGEFSAVALFAHQARRVRTSFALQAADQRSIARLCRLVEGMPLAIELAATWVRLLAVDEIVAEVERSLDFLETQMGDLPARHRSMRAVFDQSWQLLSAQEQQVLSRLSVFRGGFGRQAAERVAGASLLVLSALFTRSLLKRAETGRYDLHELVRQFAAARLAGDPAELGRTHAQHSAYYLGLLEEKEAALRSHRQKAALDELAAEMGNLRAAWEWAADRQQAAALYRAAPAFRLLFELRSWYQEGERVFSRAAGALTAGGGSGPQQVDGEPAAAALLAHSGCFLFRQGQSAAAYATLAPCAEQLRAAAGRPEAGPLPLVYTLAYLGIVCWELGRFAEAVARLQEGLALAQETQQGWYEAHFTEFLGIVARDQGDYAQAGEHLGRALAMFRAAGDQSFCAHSLSYLGRTRLAQGELQAAEGLLQESLALAGQAAYRFGRGLALDGLGQLAYARGDYPQAQALFTECAGLFEDMGDAHRLARARCHQGHAALAQGQVAGAAAAFEEALALAGAGGLMPVVLAAQAGLAAVQLRAGPSPQTLALVGSIAANPACNQGTQDLARRLQAELEARLSGPAARPSPPAAG